MLSLFLSTKRTASRFAWPTQEGLSAIIGMGVTNFKTKAAYGNEKTLVFKPEPTTVPVVLALLMITPKYSPRSQAKRRLT